MRQGDDFWAAYVMRLYVGNDEKYNHVRVDQIESMNLLILNRF